MFILYNILQLLLFPFLILLLPCYLLIRPEKLGVILPRLGFGLASNSAREHSSPSIWVHALSVGEVTSALPLTRAIREEFPNCTLIFTATTKSGHDLAEKLAGPHVDILLFFPFDILPVVNHYIKVLKPDLCIIVETDFWPNFLAKLEAENIPAILVNGRVSDRSMRSYLRFSFFSKSVFNRFRLLCMQSTADTHRMLQLGIDPHKLRTIGNLKYVDAHQNVQLIEARGPFAHIPAEMILLCGSTHPGEERIIIDVYRSLRQKGYSLHCAIAPRNIRTVDEIAERAQTEHFSTVRLSESPGEPGDITIIDTIGDLASLYYHADIAFIGGSLVPEGGHNPLEAVRAGCPVMFGPHMEDFSEIHAALVETGCGFEVNDRDELEATLTALLSSEKDRQEICDRAEAFIGQHQNVVQEHINLIMQLM